MTMPTHRQTPAEPYRMACGDASAPDDGSTAPTRQNIMVRLRVIERAPLFSGRVVLLPDTFVEAHLGLGLLLTRRGQTVPADEDARTWLALGMWLQDGTKRERRCAPPGAEESLGLAER